VEASKDKGERLSKLLDEALGDDPHVGDVRGRGLMIGIELVRDRETREPFPRAAAVTEHVVAAARDRGLLVYSSTGCANGVDGDLIMFGPPFVITEEELAEVVALTAEAVATVR
jgi:adenosylmethionine-8-amino-7-oxononanoate aminotransferase